MNRLLAKWAAIGVLLLGVTTRVLADLVLNYQNAGSDLEFHPTNDVVTIDLSLASASPWDSLSLTNGNGVYDPSRWAIVFKYSRVEIPANVTVRFKNHPSRAPVVWLVEGEVIILGHVSLDGDGVYGPGWRWNVPAEPGPGGFRGGLAGGPIAPGGGFGPGGGNYPGLASGSYFTQGSQGWGGIGETYGNASIQPLIGGSGGDGYGTTAGTAGGGALLLVCRNTLTLDGTITSYGGFFAENWGPCGSGGAVRILADKVLGAGSIYCVGGSSSTYNAATSGGLGRVRIEANTVSSAIVTIPRTVRVDPQPIWPDMGAPVLRISSIGGVSAPTDPRATVDTAGADLNVPSGVVSDILIQTANVSTNASIMVRVNAMSGPGMIIPAKFDSGDRESGLWKASATIPSGFVVFQAYGTTD